MLELIDQVPSPWREALWGALIGDALGVPHEFKDAYAIPPSRSIEMVMPVDYQKTYPSVPYGTWSDDGSLLLAMLDGCLARRGSYDSKLLVTNMLAWFQDAKYQAGGKVFDCGAQTRTALQAHADGRQPFSIGSSSYCGNGSLMRVLPFAAVPSIFDTSPRAAVEMAILQSDLTHPNTFARVCCALYVEICWLIQSGRRDFRQIVHDAAKRLTLRRVLKDVDLATLNCVISGGNALPNGSGYVVSTLWSAVWAVENAKTLSEALRAAISLGGDTDTLASVAGGMAALAYGLDAKAQWWLTQLHA